VKSFEGEAPYGFMQQRGRALDLVQFRSDLSTSGAQRTFRLRLLRFHTPLELLHLPRSSAVRNLVTSQPILCGRLEVRGRSLEPVP
jgi:hypothetical protein